MTVSKKNYWNNRVVTRASRRKFLGNDTLISWLFNLRCGRDAFLKKQLKKLSKADAFKSSSPMILDIGCGYGGLIFGLAELFPDDWILGMEIRDKVVNYVAEKILAMRQETPGKWDKTSVIRSNAMKHLPNFFEKG